MGKVVGSIGWFISTSCDAQFVIDVIKGYTKKVHASFYEKKDLMYALALSEVSEGISSVHLPNGLALSDYAENGVVDNLRETLGVDLFVVHPWAEDLDYIVDCVMRREKYCLCLETFSFGKGKGSLLHLIEKYGRYMKDSPFLGLCFDFSHIAPEFMTWTLICPVLKYAKIFHVSEVKESKEGKEKWERHCPFEVRGPFHAVSLLGQICTYPGPDVREVVLEYDKKHERRLVKDSFKLEELLASYEKRIGKQRRPENVTG